MGDGLELRWIARFHADERNAFQVASQRSSLELLLTELWELICVSRQQLRHTVPIICGVPLTGQPAAAALHCSSNLPAAAVICHPANEHSPLNLFQAPAPAEVNTNPRAIKEAGIGQGFSKKARLLDVTPSGCGASRDFASNSPSTTSSTRSSTTSSTRASCRPHQHETPGSYGRRRRRPRCARGMGPSRCTRGWTGEGT